MNSIVFNNPTAVFWFTIGCAVVIGAIITTLIFLTMRNALIRRQAEMRMPEIKAEYEAIIDKAEAMIESKDKSLTQYRLRHAQALLFASKIVTSLGDDINA